jgi:hypothetical protein
MQGLPLGGAQGKRFWDGVALYSPALKICTAARLCHRQTGHAGTIEVLRGSLFRRRLHLRSARPLLGSAINQRVGCRNGSRFAALRCSLSRRIAVIGITVRGARLRLGTGCGSRNKNCVQAAGYISPPDSEPGSAQSRGRGRTPDRESQVRSGLHAEGYRDSNPRSPARQPLSTPPR